MIEVLGWVVPYIFGLMLLFAVVQRWNRQDKHYETTERIEVLLAKILDEVRAKK